MTKNRCKSTFFISCTWVDKTIFNCYNALIKNKNGGEKTDTIWILLAWIFLGFVALTLLGYWLYKLFWEDDRSGHFWKLILCAIAVLFAFPTVFYSAGVDQGIIEGKERFQGTPISFLEKAIEYKVICFNTSQERTYITLYSIENDQMLLYKTLARNLPESLDPGDTIIYTSQQKIVVTETS